MLALDNNLLSDYLSGEESARQFLLDYEDEPWAVASVTLYEAFMGANYGYITGTIDDIWRATDDFERLSFTPETARRAGELQQAVMDSGAQLGAVDAMTAAAADEVGATIATNDKTFWKPEVTAHLDVAKYHR